MLEKLIEACRALHGARDLEIPKQDADLCQTTLDAIREQLDDVADALQELVESDPAYWDM